jgi:hypothetical protein
MKETKKRKFNELGRPPIFGEPMKRMLFFIRADQAEWINKQGGNKSKLIRAIIDQAMQNGIRNNTED